MSPRTATLTVRLSDIDRERLRENLTSELRAERVRVRSFDIETGEYDAHERFVRATVPTVAAPRGGVHYAPNGYNQGDDLPIHLDEIDEYNADFWRDEPSEEGIIEKVYKDADGMVTGVTLQGDLHVPWRPDEIDVAPERGNRLRVLAEPGAPVHGYVLDGSLVWYLDEDEREADRRRALAAYA